MRLWRFVFVGGLSTILYGMFSVALIWILNFSAFTAHLTAYALVVPFSFLGHRRITFSYSGPEIWAFIRFLVTSVLALFFSSLLVWHLEATQSPAFWGIIATMVVVPLVSYTILSLWVFPERAQDRKHL